MRIMAFIVSVIAVVVVFYALAIFDHDHSFLIYLRALAGTPQFKAMFWPALFFGASHGILDHKRPRRIAATICWAFASIPVCILIFGVFGGDMMVGVYAALFIFLAIGVGFLLLGWLLGAIGAVTVMRLLGR